MTITNGPVIEDELMELIIGKTGKQYFTPFIIISHAVSRYHTLKNKKPEKEILPVFSVLWYFYYNEFVDYITLMANEFPSPRIWDFHKNALGVLKEIGLRQYIPPLNQKPTQIPIDEDIIKNIQELEFAELISNFTINNYLLNNIPFNEYKVRQSGIQKLYVSVLGEINRFIMYPDDVLKKDFNLRNNGSLFWYSAKLLVCGDEFIQVPTVEHSFYVYKLTVLFGLAWKKCFPFVYEDLGQIICIELKKIKLKNQLLNVNVPKTLSYKDLREIRSALVYNMGYQTAKERNTGFSN